MAHILIELTDHVAGLDQWLSQGGFLPKEWEWAHSAGRARLASICVTSPPSSKSERNWRSATLTWVCYIHPNVAIRGGKNDYGEFDYQPKSCGGRAWLLRCYFNFRSDDYPIHDYRKGGLLFSAL
ncbi:hypothetical protein [Nocardia sp. IFM 10818]